MIEIRDLSFGYGHGRKVVQGLNVEFEPGHIYGLLGRNGMGKSTLLKLMCGLLHGQQGTISVDGFDPGMRNAEVLEMMRFVPETDVKSRMKVKDWVKMQAQFYPRFSAELLSKALDALEVEGDKRLNALSMGQRKKTVIATALACQTPYLLMDEPTNGMDIPSKAAFRSLLASETTEERTVIVSTHQVDDLENLIDAVTIIDNGRLLLHATTEFIGQRLAFGLVDGDAIYSETTPIGDMGVTAAAEGTENTVNLKLLFNAVINKYKTINKLLKQ